MGRRNDWNAVRMVAENIRLGDRSFWNLTMIPDLPTPGWKAIRELEEKKLVTVFGDHVAPTPAFWPWIEKLQSEETERAIARQKALLPPWQVSAPAPEPCKPTPPVPAVPDEPLSRPSITKVRATSKFRRSLFDHLKPEEALAAKILMKLEARCGFNGRITKRELEREMNANKQPRWAEAWCRLVWDKYIRVSAGPNRQQFIELLEIPDRLRPQVTKKSPAGAERGRGGSKSTYRSS